MTEEQRAFILALDKDGTISAAAILKAATPANSPIHNLFTWDNRVAGDRYRLDEARQLLGRVRLEWVHHVREITAPAYIRDPRLPGNVGGYRSVAAISTEEDSARLALKAEVARVASMIERGRTVTASLGLAAEFETALRHLLLDNPADMAV